MTLDHSLFRLVNSAAGKFQLFDWLAIFLADYLGYLLILGIILLLFQERNYKQRFYFFSLAALSVILSRGIITELIRFLYYRPRPFLVLDIKPLIESGQTGSFPSGHAAAYFALAMAVYYFCEKKKTHFSRRWEWWFVGLTLLMGLARIMIGVHWPSDILGGAIIGVLSAFLIYKILPKPNAPSENSSLDF